MLLVLCLPLLSTVFYLPPFWSLSVTPPSVFNTVSFSAAIPKSFSASAALSLLALLACSTPTLSRNVTRIEDFAFAGRSRQENLSIKSLHMQNLNVDRSFMVPLMGKASSPIPCHTPRCGKKNEQQSMRKAKDKIGVMLLALLIFPDLQFEFDAVSKTQIAEKVIRRAKQHKSELFEIFTNFCLVYLFYPRQPGQVRNRVLPLLPPPHVCWCFEPSVTFYRCGISCHILNSRYCVSGHPPGLWLARA